MPDPRTVDYAFLGMDWLGALAGLAIMAAIALTVHAFFSRRGHTGVGLWRLTLSASLPLSVAAFVLRSLTAFAVAALAHMMNPANDVAEMMGALVEATFLLSAMCLVALTMLSNRRATRIPFS